jgi:hypothetical protein
MPIPYVNIRLAKRGATGWTDEIAKVWVGPSNYQDLALKAVRMALETYGVRGCDPEIWKSPLRP